MCFERWLYAWRVRLRTLLDRDRADRELNDELHHHVALETAARRAKGDPPAEARRQALGGSGRVLGSGPARDAGRADRRAAPGLTAARRRRHGGRQPSG